MAVRTVVDSVPAVSGRSPAADAADAVVDDLRSMFPGAVILRYLGSAPAVGARVFVAPGAALVGDVTLGDDVSVWFGCVLRGDVNRIVVGARSNLQDGTVVHLGDRDPTLIGVDVVVGHRAVLHGCTIGDSVLIGVQATVLDGAVVGAGSVVGAGALVTAGTIIPERSLVLGVPARVIRSVDDATPAFHAALAAKYTRLQHNYRVG